MRPRALTAVLALTFARPLGAQAWVSPQGTGFAALAYQYQTAKEHLSWDGNARDRGRMQAHTFNLAGGFTPLPRLGLTAALSAVVTRWDNPGTLRIHGPHDDGSWHATVADARLEARFTVLEDPVVLTPLAGILVPTHDYVTAGHAASGKGLVEAPVGLYAGRTLDPLLPYTYLQARYAYSFVENIHDNETGELLDLNRSNLDLELGYFVSAALSARILGAIQWGHGGLEENEIVADQPSFDEHDRRLRASFRKVGVGATYALGPFDVSVAAFWTLWGRNSIRWYTVASVVSWSFGHEPSLFGTKTRPARNPR